MALPVATLSGTVGPPTQANLTWVAPSPTVAQLFLAAGTYNVDPFSLTVQGTAIGAGAGGQGGIPITGTANVGTSGGAGGGYAQATYNTTSLPSTVTVTVGGFGNGGAAGGGAGQSGGTSSFGTLVVATGGSAATSGNFTVTCPGGTGTVTGSPISSTTAAGGTGAQNNGGASDFDRYGGNSTLGGGGGGGGQGSATQTGSPGPGPAQNGGSTTNAAASIGSSGQLVSNTGLGPQSATAVAANSANGNGIAYPFNVGGGGGSGGGIGIAYAISSGGGLGPNNAVATATGSAGGAGGFPGGGGGGGGGADAEAQGSLGGSSIANPTAVAGGPGANGTVYVVATYPTVVLYNVYRDGNYIGSTASLAFVDALASSGLHIYTITALYTGGMISGPSNQVQLTIVRPSGGNASGGQQLTVNPNVNAPAGVGGDQWGANGGGITPIGGGVAGQDGWSPPLKVTLSDAQRQASYQDNEFNSVMQEASDTQITLQEPDGILPFGNSTSG
jgi:hypothetical protein